MANCCIPTLYRERERGKGYSRKDAVRPQVAIRDERQMFLMFANVHSTNICPSFSRIACHPSAPNEKDKHFHFSVEAPLQIHLSNFGKGELIFLSPVDERGDKWWEFGRRWRKGMLVFTVYVCEACLLIDATVVTVRDEIWR